MSVELISLFDGGGGVPAQARTNLIRLGMDVPHVASIIRGGINTWEYFTRITFHADAIYLEAMDVETLRGQYLSCLAEVTHSLP